MSLSDLKVRNLKPSQKPIKVSDSNGLHIYVTPKGTKSWRVSYRHGGKQRQVVLGTYPNIPLLEARRLRDEARRLLAKGIDPSAHKRGEVTVEGKPTETFRSVADRWFAKNEAQWVDSYGMRLRNRMMGDIFPTLGETPIGEIAPRDVLLAIRKIEDRGSIEMARRIFQMVGAVFRFAVGEGIIPFDPTRDVVDALASRRAPKHRNSVPAKELPNLMATLSEGDPLVSALGVRLTTHTMVRTNETRFAQWHEFEGLDGDEPIWRLSAERMKMRREHIVPLTKQALAIIAALREINGKSKWVFKTPGRVDKPMSENAMLYLLYRHGLHGRATVHGMRSSASTWLNEREFNRDWIELQLAHVDGSVRGIYNSALYLRQRREMLAEWSDFLEPQDDFDDLFG